MDINNQAKLYSCLSRPQTQTQTPLECYIGSRRRRTSRSNKIPRKSSKREFNQDQELREIAQTNKLIIEIINAAGSLEQPFRRCSFRWQLASDLLGLLRLLIGSVLAIKYMVLIFTVDCTYSQLRFQLYDWLVILPEERRSLVYRHNMCLCLVQLAQKRACLFRRRFDASLLSWLSKPPPAFNFAGPAKLTRPCDQQPVSGMGTNTRASYQGRLVQFRAAGAALDWRQDRPGWLAVSGALRRWLLRTSLLWGAFVITVVSGILLKAFSKFEPARQCDLVSPSLLWVACLEIIYLAAEQAMMLVSAFTHVLVVREHLFLQLDSTRRHLKRALPPPPSAPAPEWQRKSTVTSLYADRKPQPTSASSMQAQIYLRCRRSQQLVGELLASLERHKPLISFLVSTVFLWYLTVLSFAPLLVSQESASSERRRSLRNIAILVSISLFAFLVLGLICASCTRKIIALSQLMFAQCAQSSNTSLDILWNRMFYVWFTPERCSFRVGVHLKLNHAGILKSLGYLITGMTLILTLRH